MLLCSALNASMTTVCFDVDTHLWSGSVDATVRVWDLSSGSCLGVLSSLGAGQGHADAVTCLEYIPGGPEPLMASGGADGAVKIWNANGGFVLSVMHTTVVTSLLTFKDSLGGTVCTPS
jgi:WD40 repeat protein